MDPEKNLQKSVPVKDGALQEKNSCNNNLGESRGENASRKGKCFANCCTSLSDFIVSILERAFYR